jgi:hypothetical protein
MAWLWKRGRPTLLAIAGLSVLGYKAFSRERIPTGQRQVAVKAAEAPSGHAPLPTPTPAVTPTPSGFLGGLHVKDLTTRVLKEV